MSSFTNVQLYLLAVPLLALVIGVTEIALERTVVDNYREHVEPYTTRWPLRPGADYRRPTKELSLMPANLTSAPTYLIITCGALSISTGIACLARLLAIANARLDTVAELPCLLAPTPE
jgi:hypothetical protein